MSVSFINYGSYRFGMDITTGRKHQKSDLESFNSEIIVTTNYPISEYSQPVILQDTKNIRNNNFTENQARCMQVYFF